jgi:NAD(P)-dependent dehydrogenase (short-subunit alcohol dehydrogenase family)
MMRATCQDMLGTGMHTACICPGFTDTEMLRGLVDNSEEVLASLAGNVILGRLVDPVEIAKLLLFSAENPVINGAVLHANLGQVEH